MFGRHTGVTNEPRAIVADWNPGEQRLTVYHGTQAPHMTQDIFARHLGLESHQVRVITKDVGGSFGIKVHIYADEMATVALSKLLKRPVKFVADRSKASSPTFMRAITASKRENRREKGRHHHRLRDRRSDRHRALFGLSAHQRHRGQPGGQPGRRPLRLPELPRPRPRRLSEQERHVPIPRGRPSDRDRGHRGLGRSRGGEDRHGPGGTAAAQSYSPTTLIRRPARPASSSRSSRTMPRSTRSWR